MKKKTVRTVSIIILIVVTMSAFLTSCGNSGKDAMTVEYCRIVNKVVPADAEYNATTVIGGKKFVDLCLYMNNLNGDDLDDVSGSVEIDGKKTELEYCKESRGSTSIEKGPVTAGEVTRIHLVAPISEEDAEKEGMTVKFTVSGKEYSADVEKEITEGSDPLGNKTQLNVGDKIDVNGIVSIEVIESKLAENGRLGKKFRMTYTGYDTVLKIKNISGADIDPLYISSINFYYLKDGKLVRGSERAELNSKLPSSDEIKEFENGDEYYVHLLGYKPDDYFRFNLFGNLYYIAPTE